jgi:hypothetical protein
MRLSDQGHAPIARAGRAAVTLRFLREHLR